MKNIVSILMIMILTIPLPSLATCEQKKQQCEEVLKVYKKIGDAQLKELIKQHEVITDQDKLITELNVELEEANKIHWYENPILIFSLGVLGGVLLQNQLETK